ncbi:MAG TPA: hypothetical protein VIJ68_01845, partial [Candidatus Saccharimonadales bacterium]
MRRLFYRNVNAGDYLEIFLVSAISALLLLRFFLYLSGYPQVGGGSLHIAHMLWGGLLMLVAIIFNLAFLGARVQRLSAFLGGAGFGIFIDELGKFLTKDNNYFFRPTIGLIYAIFMALYLVFNSLSRTQRLTHREYELNALAQLEEAVQQDLDGTEKRRIVELLANADAKSPITQELKQLLARLDTVPPSKPNRLARWLTAADKRYERFWHLRSSRRLVAALFVIQAAVFLIVTLGTVLGNFDEMRSIFRAGDPYANKLLAGQLIASAAAGVFAVLGAVRLLSSRLEAFELFRRAVLINLLITEFFT